MARKQRKVIKTDSTVGTEKKEVTQVVAPPKPPTISTLEEATELVKESFTKPFVLEYVVLENTHVFYGYNRNTALKYANKFGLKYFDVKLKT